MDPAGRVAWRYLFVAGFSEELLDVLVAEAAVRPFPHPVGWKQAVVAPVPHRVDMYMERSEQWYSPERASSPTCNFSRGLDMTIGYELHF